MHARRKMTLVSTAVQRWLLISILAVLCLATAVQAQHAHYFIGVDGREIITSGNYAGLANPNFGRLTFLFAHTSEENPPDNHFHGIGAYSYTGPADNPTVVPTNTNNRIPEGFSGEPPLPLSPAVWLTTPPPRFRRISKPGDSEYSHLKIDSIYALSGYPSDSPEGYLYNSSGNRWSAPLTGAVIALELVGITPGLAIANEARQTVLAKVGDIHVLGDGNTFSFTPIFWTKGLAAPGVYSAALRIHDLRSEGTPFGISGTFYLDFVVP
jgi:hypothetical protein